MKREDIAFNKQKFGELIIYLANKSDNDPLFGLTKLYKLLYYSDFFYYAEHGKPITGAEYRKLEHGPAPRMALPVTAELAQRGEIIQKTGSLGRHPQKKIIALRDADLSLFSPQEIAMIDRVFEEWGDSHASAMSAASHEMAGWKTVDLMEHIPYESIFLPNDPSDMGLTEEDINYGREVGRRIDA